MTTAKQARRTQEIEVGLDDRRIIRPSALTELEQIVANGRAVDWQQVATEHAQTIAQLLADKAALVEALRETTRQLDDAKSTMIELGGEMPSACDDALDIARAALAAAGEQS